MINTCPPLHKTACSNGACGRCEPVPVETEHTPMAERAQLLELEPKRRGRPPRARAA